MIRRQRGFTLIELLITIAIIGILASIVAVIWTGLLAASQERERQQDVRTWITTLDTYKNHYLSYPVTPTSNVNNDTYCLGTFTAAPFNGKCARYASSGKNIDASRSNATLLPEIAKIGRIPTNSGQSVDNAFVGPYLYINQTTSGSSTTTSAYVIGFFKNTCSSMDGFKDALTDANTPSHKLYPSIDSLTNAGDNVNICYLSSQYTTGP